MLSSHPLLQWYHQSKRALPWRLTTNPYLIWVSEVILQQTRIDQGTAYYERFISRFPTIASLAMSTEEEVLLMWQGLGYYSRARNLLKAARMVMDRYNGEIPTTVDNLLTLSGIGDYTASAIASISYGTPSPAIDGNVMRVIGRCEVSAHATNSRALKSLCHSIIIQMMDGFHAGDVNQAIMELGATVCKPLAPLCSQCSIQRDCKAFSLHLQTEYPVVAQKSKPRARYFTYLVLIDYHNDEPYIIVNKRQDNDIWNGLYELPLIETKNEPTDQDIEESELWKTLDRNRLPDLANAHFQLHRLTHQLLHCRFIREQPSSESFVLHNVNFKLVPIADLHLLAFPQLIVRYLDKTIYPIYLNKQGL